MDNVTDVIFFIVSKVHFLLLLSKRWIRENNKYTKNAKNFANLFRQKLSVTRPKVPLCQILNHAT